MAHRRVEPDFERSGWMRRSGSAQRTGAAIQTVRRASWRIEVDSLDDHADRNSRIAKRQQADVDRRQASSDRLAQDSHVDRQPNHAARSELESARDAVDVDCLQQHHAPGRGPRAASPGPRAVSREKDRLFAGLGPCDLFIGIDRPSGTTRSIRRRSRAITGSRFDGTAPPKSSLGAVAGTCLGKLAYLGGTGGPDCRAGVCRPARCAA